MANVLTLTTPLMRQTVGFDRFNDLFEALLSEKADGFDNYPPYNIEKHGENDYRIVMAVAGFSIDDLEMALEDGELTVSGELLDKPKDHKNVELLHRGIGTRAFRKTFRLADYIRVTQAEVKDGLLIISLERKVPEEKKRRFIPILSVPSSEALENKGKKK